MKKLILFFVGAAIALLTFLPTVSAYPGGLLHGKPGWMSYNNQWLSQFTDGNTNTSEQFFYNEGYIRWILSTPQSVARWKTHMRTNYAYAVRFYDENTVLIYDSGARYNSQDIHLDKPIDGVVQVRLVSLSSNRNEAAEFDVFPDTTPPPMPTGVTVKPSSGQTYITWTASGGTTAGYHVYIDGVKVTTTPITTTSYTAIVSDNVEHTVQVTSVNSNGNESERTAAVISYFDNRPKAPKLLTANVTSGQVTLTWENTQAQSYNVYRDGSKVNSSPIVGTTYTVTGLSDNTDYAWQVSGVIDPYESALSNTLVTNNDTIPPDKPSGLVATPQPNRIHLEWFANKGDGAIGYYVYRDQVKITTAPVTGTSYTINGIPGVSNEFQVTAVDAARNESEKSDPVSAEALDSPDLIAPAAPTGFKATAQAGSVRLTWNANAESDLAGYYIYRSGTRLNQTPITTTNYNVIGGMSWGIGYRFEVSAVDKAGNESPKSDSETAAPIKPNDLDPPGTPQGLTGLISTDALSILLSWNANNESDLSGYNLYVSTDGISYLKVNGDPISGLTYEYEGIQGNTKYYYKLTAVDQEGNESKQTKALAIKTPTREVDPVLEPTKPKLIINWAPVHGAVQYLIYYQDQLYAIVPSNTTSYEITLADGYNPELARQNVVVKAKFIDGSIGQDPPGGGQAAKKWGFGPLDIFNNTVFLIGTVAGFVLFGLLFRLLPWFIQTIKNAVNRRKGAGV